MNGKLILVRHAQSIWNKQNRLSGNSQIGLTPEGLQQSVDAAKELLEKNIKIDIAFSSDQKRAFDTMDIMLKEIKFEGPKFRTPDLRESELGAINGMKIEDIEKEYGKDFVFKLIREFDTKAPAKEGEPAPESLGDMVKRVGDFHEKNVKKHIEKGKNVLIIAHDGTLRAYLSYLGELDVNQSRIIAFDNAKPFIYEFKEGDDSEDRLI
jgi:2,3-bisphosphoglycerate-dependent phosphoglycerate mutase